MRHWAVILLALFGFAALAQAPVTDVLLAPLPAAGAETPHAVTADSVTRITDREGYDNQPSFTPDGAAVLYVSMDEAGQTDIYRYDLSSGETAQVTDTPESEFSPVVTPSGEHLAAVRIEADGATQRLWRFDLMGENAEAQPEDVDRVGYYAFVGERLALIRVDEETNGLPLALFVTDLETGETVQVAENVGVGVQRVPGQNAVSFVQRLDDGSSSLSVYDLASRETRDLTPTLPQVDAHAWLPDGTLLAAQDSVIYSWREGQDGWQPYLDFGAAGISGIGRLSVSPDGTQLAFVISR